MYNSTIANATPDTPAAVRARLCVMLAHASSDWIDILLAGLDLHLHLMAVVARCGAFVVETDADLIVRESVAAVGSMPSTSDLRTIVPMRSTWPVSGCGSALLVIVTFWPTFTKRTSVS